MFLHGYHFHTVGTRKSVVLGALRFLQSLGISIVIIVLPLYLFDFFQSAFKVGQIETIGAFVTIVLMFSFGYLLSKFHRSTLFRIAMILGIIGLFFLIFMQSYFHAILAGVGAKIIAIITGSILALYVRDVVAPQKLLKFQSIFTALSNSALLIGPIFAGWMMSALDSYGSLYDFFFNMGIFDPEYIKYQAPLFFAVIIHCIVLGLFMWNKWYMRHVHLQEVTKEPVHTNPHHPWHLRNFVTFFRNPFRVLSFMNSACIGVWWITLYVFFPLLLQRHGLADNTIGLVMGCAVIPLIIGEMLLPKFIHKFQSSFSALIFGYTIFAIFIILAFVFGYDHLFWFVFFVIFSQFGVAITEPLQTYQFFEGTTKSEETRYYSLSLLGGVTMRFLTPVVFGFFVNFFTLNTVFTFLPYYLFFVVILFVWYYARVSKLRDGFHEKI